MYDKTHYNLKKKKKKKDVAPLEFWSKAILPTKKKYVSCED